MAISNDVNNTETATLDTANTLSPMEEHNRKVCEALGISQRFVQKMSVHTDVRNGGYTFIDLKCVIKTDDIDKSLANKGNQ